MKITDLTAETCVKLHDRSITVFNQDTGKTTGVIRGVLNYDNISPRDKFNWRNILSAAPYERVYSDGKRLYYIHNSIVDRNAEIYGPRGGRWLEFVEYSKRDQAIAEKARAAGFTVVSACVFV